MAADGMDKKGRNSPDSASEELFDLSRSAEDDSRREDKDLRESDPPVSSNSTTPEIVDLPNIHFGSRVGDIAGQKSQNAAVDRLTDTTSFRDTPGLDPADRETSPLSGGRLGEPGSSGEDVPSDPAGVDGNPGLGRSKTLLRPIGPTVSSRDALPAKAEATDINLAANVVPGADSVAEAPVVEGGGASPAPPTGSAPTTVGASFSIGENASTGDAVGTVIASDPDVGDTLAFSITGGNVDGAFAIDPATGAVTVANASLLDHETVPSRIVTVTVTDSAGLTSTAAFTIGVTDANEAPIAADQSYSISEGASNGDAVGTVAASDPDAGDTVTYAITGGNADGAFAIDPAIGAVTVADASLLDHDTMPSRSVTITVTDAAGLTDTATVTIAVTDSNSAPVAADQSFSVSEGASNGDAVGTVAASDPDVGDTVTYAITGGNADGAFAIDPTTGAVTVADASLLDHETTPSRAVTVTVTDAAGLTDTATITVGVTDANEAPIAADQSFSVSEGASNGDAVGTVAASDPDVGDTVTYAITGGNADGAFAIDPTTGAVTIADASLLDHETTPSRAVTVTVTDAAGLTDAATVTVGVTDANEAPIAADQSFSVSEGASNGDAVGTVAASDPDTGDTVTYAITGGNADGAFAIDPTTGAVTVADASLLDHETTPSRAVTITVTDAAGLTDTATVTVGVTDANEAPIAADQSFSVSEGASNGDAVGTVAASDPDVGDTVTYAITGGNADGAFAIDPTTGAVTVADASLLDHETTPSRAVTITVTDAAGLTDTATVTVGVTDANEAPIAADQSFSVSEGASNGDAVGTVAASDPDVGDTVTYAITGGNADGSFAIDPTTGAVTVADASLLDHETTPSRAVTVTVTDAAGLTDTATITVGVTDANEAPIAADQSFSVSEGASNGDAVGTVAASDPDVGDTVTYAITGGNADGAFAIDPTTGAVTIADASLLDHETTPSRAVTVTVTDAAGLTDTATITVGVTDANEAPIAADQSFSVSEGASNGDAVGTVAASDPDVGDTVTYAITSGNADGAFAIDPTTGAVTVADASLLDHETTPSRAVTVTVTDAAGLTDTATITVGVTDANEAPIAADQSFSVSEGASNGDAVGTVAASDPDAGDTVTYAITGGNADGAFAIDPTTGAVTVADASLLDHETTPSRAVTVTVTDAAGLTDTATITVGVTDANEAPIAADQSFSVSEGASNGDAVGTVAASDPDAGDTVTYAITGGNADGAFAIDPTTGAVTVADASLLDHETTPSRAVTVTVTDAAGLTDTATITVGVTDANEAPIAADQSFSVSEGASNGDAVGTVAASDPDVGDTVTYAITGGNADGAFAIDPTTGAVTVADASLLDHETTPSRAVTVTVTDAAGLTDTATITVGVTDANEAPIAADQSFSVSEGASNGDAVGTVAASDPDTGDTVTYAITSGNADGAFAIDPTTGAVTVADTSLLDHETTPSRAVTVTVTDAAGLTDTATVTVGVTDVNEAPIAADQSFSVSEGASNGDAVGTVAASDPDVGDTVSYAITGGNADGAFAIDPTTGAVTVADASLLDHETTPSRAVTVTVTDAAGLTDTATITVGVTDANEAPIAADQSFSVSEGRIEWRRRRHRGGQ